MLNNKELISVTYRQELVGVYNIKTKFIAEITHKGLNEYKIITSYDYRELDKKVNSLVSKLEEKWNKISSKVAISNNKKSSQKEADEKTNEAFLNLRQIDNILLNTNKNIVVNWEKLMETKKFNIPNPEIKLQVLLNAVKKPSNPTKSKKPSKPTFKSYEPKFTILDNLFKSKKEAKNKTAQLLFEEALKDWNLKCLNILKIQQKKEEEFNEKLVNYEKKIEEVKRNNSNNFKKWKQLNEDFITNQKDFNGKIKELEDNYIKRDVSAVVEYCTLVLNSSDYPHNFPKKFELDYNPETKILVVDYSLPSIELLPTLKEAKLIKNEIKEYHISESQTLKMFDNTMYNITLRTIFESFKNDKAKAIEAISFNGWVNTLNKGNGKRNNICILSIQVKKKEFMEINLENVDAKTCFKNFKGIGSSTLSSLSAIQPILQINRNDKRFTNHYAVAQSLDNSLNLASMDWQDFEHLIREIFEKEFSANGGEVKVTQASRDGGVDAIAFDPDPIRGGKIVIQAKRYTNTVSVSAVRDLYGTVMNEGATKGILVTTADYGPDSYEFVKGKPLTLMNGSNLLYLKNMDTKLKLTLKRQGKI